MNCIPVLTCQLHQGLLVDGEHLTRRCQGWTEDKVRKKSWFRYGRLVLKFTPIHYDRLSQWL